MSDTQRVNKFRSWLPDYKKFIYFDLNNPDDGLFGRHGVLENTGHESWQQFIGLLDKNGVEIYEGDIVNGWSQGSNQIGVIKWGQGLARFFIHIPPPVFIWTLSGSGPNHDEEMIEVIGNIYQNPELLKEEK